MAANGISTLTISSGTTVTKDLSPAHTNTEIVPPYSAIWSLNYSPIGLGVTNDTSYKLYVTSLGIGSAFTLISQYPDQSVPVGKFGYDVYGASIGIIKGDPTIDNYMAKAAALVTQDNTIVSAATYKGTWDAFSDTPTLTDGVGTLGDAYDVTVAGTNGAYPEYVNQDWRIYNGATWVKVDHTITTQWTIKPAVGGLADKEARQIAKLDIAEAKRQGKVVADDGTITGSIDPTKPYYRNNNQYDIAQLPTQYDDNAVVNNPNTGGLLQGRPWSPDTIITVIEEGLVLNLDARNLNSWSREPGEDTWYDLSGNNNHATVYGGIAYGEALGGALAFDGSDAQYAQCVPGVYFTSAGYTIQSWVYIISVPNWNRIIDFGSSAGSDNVLLSATLGQTGNPTLWTGPVPGETYVESTVQLQPNTGWHHVCATWNPIGTVGKVFIDGVMTGSGNLGAPVAGVRANCYIGRSNWGYPPVGPDPNFNGGMGAIQIYGRTLSDAEITQNYNTTKSYYGL